MANRPKRYGGMNRQRQETRSRYGRQDDDRLERAGRPQRASEAEIWEREESLHDQDLDMGDDLANADDLDELDDAEDVESR